ncbi:MAG TPA: LamG-like jellyroll fold domain-containing protein [Methylomirabilota bacterium]|nr:LamG-like jellyroll fold domain-containing protein [Methylomirabilota bacterium]
MKKEISMSATSFLRSLTIPVGLGLLVAVTLNTEIARGAVIAHWSFDTATITVDGSGNVLTAADDTGIHNATGVLNGTATSASVAGQFGTALQLNNTAGTQAANNYYMTFANLIELMGSTGPSYTIAAWVNTVNTADNNTILGDWGNAPAGTDRFIYWFSVNNSSGQGRPRAQTRAQNLPSNDDIIAQQPAVNVASSTWRHIAWTFDKSAATLKTFVDGVLVDTLSAIAPPLHITNSASSFGAIGRKADNNRYFVGAIDEIWVLDEAIDDAAVQVLFNSNVAPGSMNPPAITRPPANATVYENGTTNLSVVASGTPAFQYTWYHFQNMIEGATNATLVLSNVSLGQAGEYSVAVTNAFGGDVSDVATLTVLPTEVPTITQPPQPITRYKTGSGAFHVTAAGAASFGYQWQFDTADIPDATNSSFTVTNIQPQDEGNYRVVVTNSAGSVTSVIATLTILTPALDTYTAYVLEKGPAAYWRLNETSGSVAYDYFGGHDGTYANVSLAVQGMVTGDSNTAAGFNGTNSVVTTGKSIMNALSAFSIVGWIRPGATQFNRAGLFGQNDVAEFGFINPTNIQIWTPGGGNLTVPYAFPTDEWHHVAAVANGTNLKIFFDGVLQNTGGTVTANYGSSGFGFNIGGGGIFDTTTNFFRGTIDEVAVFARGLSDADITDLYQAATPPPSQIAISIARTPGGVTLTWPSGTLQYAEDLAGDGAPTVWTDLPDATSPFFTNTPAPQQFFRIRR